jgi:hypothetical protein
MTVIAWDGRSLAVDRLATSFGLAAEVKKYKRLSTKEVLVCYGDHDKGLIVMNWYEKGGDPEKYPKFQATDDWAGLVVASDKGIKIYNQEPVPLVFEDKFQAWGSGRDYALGAMAMGADAKKAVEITCELNVYCGKGIDVFHFGESDGG